MWHYNWANSLVRHENGYQIKMHSINIDIFGAGYHNKGAELMLTTVCDQLRSKIDLCKLSIPLTRYERFEDRCKNLLRTSYNNTIQFSRPARIYKDIVVRLAGASGMAEYFGLINEKSIDAVLDISGYLYGDFWPQSKLNFVRDRYRTLKRSKKPVILLPQMLGPFEKAATADAFSEIASYSNLVYARDKRSFSYAEGLVDASKLRLCPDITINASAVGSVESPVKYGCIVPNSKLLDERNQDQGWVRVYLERLDLVSREFTKSGLVTKIVLHEGSKGDLNLARALSSRLEPQVCSIVGPTDARILKSILAASQVVVGSRYHSLVGALSTGVPSIALGWAHKYQTLFEDFGMQDFVYSPNQSSIHLAQLVDRTIRERDELKEQIIAAKVRLSATIDEMWADVISVLINSVLR